MIVILHRAICMALMIGLFFAIRAGVNAAGSSIALTFFAGAMTAVTMARLSEIIQARNL